MNGLRIQNPCHESWSEMLPNTEGRFCGSCQKTVVDFTRFSDEKLKDYFQARPYDERTCGRFLNRQLDQKIVVISSKVLYSSRLSFNQFFFLCALVCFSTFFSCTKEEGGKMTKVKIMVEDSAVQKDSSVQPTKPISCEPIVIERNLVTRGDIDSSNLSTDTFVQGIIMPPEALGPDDEFMFVDEEPEFLGDTNLSAYLSKRIQNPNNYSGRIFVSFLIDKEGLVKNPTLLTEITKDSLLEKHVLEELEKMPAWKPGQNNGKTVKVRMNIPIVFKP